MPKNDIPYKIGQTAKKASNIAKNLFSNAKDTWKKNNERIRKGPNKPVKTMLTNFDKAIESFKGGYKSMSKGGRIMGEACFRNQKD